jgi:hypothetical protein
LARVSSATRNLAGPHLPTAFAFVAPENQQRIGALVRLLELVHVGEMLFDERPGSRNALRHPDMTALGTRTLHAKLRHGSFLFRTVLGPRRDKRAITIDGW